MKEQYRSKSSTDSLSQQLELDLGDDAQFFCAHVWRGVYPLFQLTVMNVMTPITRCYVSAQKFLRHVLIAACWGLLGLTIGGLARYLAN